MSEKNQPTPGTSTDVYVVNSLMLYVPVEMSSLNLLLTQTNKKHQGRFDLTNPKTSVVKFISFLSKKTL